MSMSIGMMWKMSYEIRLKKSVLKFIQSRNQKEKNTIKIKFALLEENPYPNNIKLDIKKLQSSEFFRLRVNDYRFIYEIIENELIIDIQKSGNRGEVYKWVMKEH